MISDEKHKTINMKLPNKNKNICVQIKNVRFLNEGIIREKVH
jgi:hypothetical protein